jgi:hypothetical protein
MVTLKDKVHGFAILESVIAMIVIMICFGMAMMIFTSILGSSRGKLTVEARIALQSEAAKCKLNDQVFNGYVEMDGFTIERKVLINEEHSELITFVLLAKKDDGQVIAEYYENLPIK